MGLQNFPPERGSCCSEDLLTRMDEGSEATAFIFKALASRIPVSENYY